MLVMTTERFRDLSRTTHVYTVVMWCAFLGASAWAAHLARLEVVAGLTVVFAGANLVPPVPNPRGGVNVPNLSVIAVTALLWHPAEVLLGVGFGHLLGQVIFRKIELWRAMLNAALQGLPAAAASAGAHEVVVIFGAGYGPLIPAGLAAVVTYRILNTGLFSGYRSARYQYPFLSDWWRNVSANWPSQLLSAPMAALLAAIAYRMPSVWSVMGLTWLSALTLPIARYELAYYQRSRKIFDEIVESVMGVLDRVVPGSDAHSRRVSSLAVAVATRLRLPERTIVALGLAAQLHDIGLLGGPGATGSSGDHAVIGARILARFPDRTIAEIVHHHHDRWDQGADTHRRRPVAVASRVLAACEVYDSARMGLAPFHASLSHADAAAVLHKSAGGLLDPEVVPVVLEVAAAHPTP